ncbi:MAG: hypothetical protein ACE5K7_04660, partial [Phycisphaerae bacterium]
PPQSPTAGAVRFHLARVLAAQGDQLAARQQLDQALALVRQHGGLSTKERREAQALIRSLGGSQEQLPGRAG